MITIVHRQRDNLLVQTHVCEDATPGSWGSHQLLLHSYRLLCPSDHWDQAKFNIKWLRDMELDYGPLWCCYCGKEELVIYDFHEKKKRSNMATVDHLIPISKAPHLAKERSNLRVACEKCNTKKASDEWKVQFPYD